MAFTNMDADAFMTAHMGDNEEAYADAVESKIAEHEAWSSPLIDLVLNYERPITSCFLKAVKTGCNALEWAAMNDADAFREHTKPHVVWDQQCDSGGCSCVCVRA